MPFWVVLSLCLSTTIFHTVSAEQTNQDPASEDVMIQPPVLLVPGQIQMMEVGEVTRVAIGNPLIADVTIVSPTEIMLQAKQAGSTNLILWDAQGQRETTIGVLDPKPEIVSKEIAQMIEQLQLLSVIVRLQGDKVFLLGEVSSDQDMQALEQVASTFDSVVVNLVSVTPGPPEPIVVAPLVKLSVQVLELNRSELEQIGFSWSTSVAFTEPETTDQTLGDALTLFGTSLTRSSFGATLSTLVQNNKARILSEPTLVTASGKSASSFIGVEVPVIQATSAGSDTSSVSASIEFRETGVLLKMTPTVIEVENGRKITTKLIAEVSDVDASVGLSVPVGSRTILVPGFKVRKAETEFTTASGETIFIAGLLDLNDQDNVTQVPGLGSIPIIGRLFRAPDIQSTTQELVITVTPELLEDESDELERGMALEQALAVAEVTASVEDPRLRYALSIQQRIGKRLRYPEREKELGIDGTVKLRLHLYRDGTLGRAFIAESSGLEAFDLEALKVAESQAPYPPFPRELTEQELWLEVPVIFRP